MVNCNKSTTYSCCDWQATLQSRKVGKQNPGLTSAVFELSWDLRSSTWSWSSLTSAITALPDTGVLGLIGQCWCRVVAGLLNPFPLPLVSLTHRHKWGGDRSGLGSNLPLLQKPCSYLGVGVPYSPTGVVLPLCTAPADHKITGVPVG